MSTRTAYVGIRATPREHAAWKVAAAADGRTLSQWIVRRANGQPATAPNLEPEAPSKAPRKTPRKR